MRLFIAIELPDDVRHHLVRVRDRLKPHLGRASLTRDQNLHITVKFLGETDDKTLAALCESMSHVRVGGAISLAAEGIECFPNRGPVRIIAGGFGGDLNAIHALHQAVEQRCQKLGFTRESRAYRPHVTLARARPTWPQSTRGRCADAVAGLFPGPGFSVSRIVLMRSFLEPAGSRYENLAHFDLLSRP